MSTQSFPPHFLFRELIAVLDVLRRESLMSVTADQQKKMFCLTVRQGSAISQLKLLTENEPQGIALKTLAKQMQMTVPATSLLVETMVTKGFFERRPNPADRRSVCIRLSEKGMLMFEDVYAQLDRAIDRCAAGVTEEELKVLSDIVAKLRAAR